MRRWFGTGVPNWPLFFRVLLSDIADDGKSFTWFSPAQLWWLRNEAMWRPGKGPYRKVSVKELRGMSIGQIRAMLRWVKRQREEYAQEHERAVEKARQSARR